ncbi:MAG TPA: TonB-dependent receptor plug domain-containing protein, partial [Terriglobales bacterium]
MREAPSSVSIITADEIRRYGWRTLGDALRSLRGFYTSYDRQYVYLGVRGFLRPGDYNCRILLLLNGHRLNENVFDSAPMGTEFPLDLDLVDHIEVVRGPGSSLFGANAVFGVINVITRRAVVPPAIEVSGDVSSFLGRTGRVTAFGTKGRLSMVLSGSPYRDPGHSRLYFPEFDSPATNNGYAEDMDGTDAHSVFADVQYANVRLLALISDRAKSYPTASYGAAFNDPADRLEDRRGFVDLSYHRSLPAQTDLDARVYYDAYSSFGT